jgi:dihydrofolate reductase
MAKLIYSTIASLDGYTVDATGDFSWGMPDDPVHRFINDLERPVGTYLYGRRMYETMVAWETADGPPFDDPHMQDFAAIWQAAEKVVYSTTLAAPSSQRTRIEPTFDPTTVAALKAAASKDLGIGGPHLAAHAITAGLVDEYRCFIAPVVVGGGTRALPDGVRFDLELIDQHRFESGFVYLRYAVR